MSTINNGCGFTTITTIKTENPKVLDTIIKDGKIDLTATPSKETHILKNFYSTMRWAEIETKNGSFRDVGEQLNLLFPDTTIQLDEMTYSEGYNTRRVYEYQNGRCERISKTECELRIESIEHLVGYKISQELEALAKEMHHFLHEENLRHLDYQMVFGDMTIITRLDTTIAKFEIDREQVEEKDDEERAPVSTFTIITTHNTDILSEFIICDRLDFRQFNIKHQHRLLGWDHQLKYAKIYTHGGTFEEIAVQLSEQYPDEYIKCEYFTDEPVDATKEIVEYKNGKASIVKEKEIIKAAFRSGNSCRKAHKKAYEQISRIHSVVQKTGAKIVSCSFFIDMNWEVRTREFYVGDSLRQETRLAWELNEMHNHKKGGEVAQGYNSLFFNTEDIPTHPNKQQKI